MKLSRWLTVILMMGVILALSSLAVQADPDRPYYHHPHGYYGWDGPRHHGFDRYDRHSWRHWRGPHSRTYAEKVYTGPPAVAYVAPTPVIGIPYSQPQPYFSKPGLSGTLQYNF